MTLSSLIGHHKLRSSFEEFATLAYSPAPLTNLFVADPSQTGGRSNLTLSSQQLPLTQTMLPPMLPPPPAPEAMSNSGGGHQDQGQTSPRNLKKLTANIKATLQGHPSTQKRTSSVSGMPLEHAASQLLQPSNAAAAFVGSGGSSGGGGQTSPSAAINNAAANLHSRLKRN